MGLRDIFKRKKKEIPLPPMPEMKKPDFGRQVGSEENLKAKMDLIATTLESIKMQQDMLNERLEKMDKILEEIYIIAKRS